MTVRQLLSSLDSAELTEWGAYFKIENERIKNHGKDELPVEEKMKLFLKPRSKK